MNICNPDIFRANLLAGRVAVVTGGSRGIGRAVCLTLAKIGAQVVVGYHRDSQAAEDTCSAAMQSKTTALAVQVDIADRQDAFRLMERAQEAFGRVDILVNCAGIWPTANAWDMSQEHWRQTLAVNLDGTFYACQAACTVMMPQREGRIVNFSSVAATRGARTGHADYAASKSGVDALTKSLAHELAPYNINVNAVSPGMISTRMTEHAVRDRDSDYVQQIPLGRVGSPEDVAGLAVFLASPAADYITGQVFHVNGGMLMP
jgi:3-oxoacyl-[acyl-carrier protein] reductase